MTESKLYRVTWLSGKHVVFLDATDASDLYTSVSVWCDGSEWPMPQEDDKTFSYAVVPFSAIQAGDQTQILAPELDYQLTLRLAEIEGQRLTLDLFEESPTFHPADCLGCPDCRPVMGDATYNTMMESGAL